MNPKSPNAKNQNLENEEENLENEEENLENEKQKLGEEKRNDFFDLKSRKYGVRWKPKYAFLNDKTDYSERGFM